MANEKYVNYYIEVLTSTLTDCVVRNVSMQANAKITDDVIEEQNEKLENLSGVIKEQEDLIRKLRENNSVNENNIITDLKNKVSEKDNELNRLSNVINELNTKYRDYDSVKNQSVHVETFKNELVRAREDIVNTKNDYERRIQTLNSENKSVIDNLTKKYDEEKADLQKQITNLKAKIDTLQSPPAKKKKNSELNKGESSMIINVLEEEVAAKDGGIF